jgi:TPR repeat protein
MQKITLTLCAFIAVATTSYGAYNKENISPNQQACEQNKAHVHPDDLYDLAAAYMHGKGVKKDFKKAETYLNQAAQMGDAKSLYYLGINYITGDFFPKKPKIGLEYLISAHKKKLTEATHALAYHYFEGKNTKKDPSLAFSYFEDAASKDHPDALYQVGLHYFNGDVVPQNQKTAFTYFRTAAIKDHPYALYYAASCYFYGHGTNRDYRSAATYFNRAHTLGHADSTFWMGLLHLEGYHFRVNKEKAIEYFRLAENHAPSLFQLACICLKGHIANEMPEEAINYLIRPAAMKDPRCLMLLSLMCKNGIGCQKDEALANNYKNAAAQTEDEYQKLTWQIIDCLGDNLFISLFYRMPGVSSYIIDGSNVPPAA